MSQRGSRRVTSVEQYAEELDAEDETEDNGLHDSGSHSETASNAELLDDYHDSTLRGERRDAGEVRAEMDARELTAVERATEHFASTGELPPIIGRFLEYANGDEAAALRCWRTTLEWRVRENMNEILREPQPDFDKIKQYYPHFYHGKSKQGHQVYYELPGRVDLTQLHASGVTFESLLRYYLFSAEFLQSVLLPSDDGKIIIVFDCAGLKMLQVPKEVKRFMKAANALISEHFPKRSFRVFVINAPRTFPVLWQVVKRLIRPATRAKVKFVRGQTRVLKALSEHIELDQIPRQYGGTSPFKPGAAPEETKLADLVHALSVE